ncbi:hypothetical protein FraQA3DRAFT_3680 [Frankia sp. QA3]|nr:hypothetical protein [Frankia sp. QA3]EIV93953.1 hypothetical protein FraQA3DRAFT_3680 [Frankia sp. QA3]
MADGPRGRAGGRGIEFGEIVTKATLAEALALALRRDGFRFVRRVAGAESR